MVLSLTTQWEHKNLKMEKVTLWNSKISKTTKKQGHMSRKTKTGRDTKNTRTCLMSLEDNTNRNACVDGERLLMDCLFANNGFPCMDGDKKKGCLDAHGRKISCIAWTLKHPKSCMRGNPWFGRFSRGSLISHSLGQKCVALMWGRGGESPYARAKIRREKFGSPPSDTPSYLHLPATPPKVTPQFSPFRALRP
jgi:hypothetical protein